ncbi:ATP-binding protein [Actinotalea sp. K2]|uniref:ATP-binding protein n=1 Tax=Actinotalea sp. K2 TaxID=2939438 RepID=UPI002017061F|nr:ATP-binding protein [Actinotalea sp. K2]MCL3862488.1 ATP-binding protein [Actinotalea sp. K2]
MDERATWMVTTHDWAKEVDVEHLAQVRDDPDSHGSGCQRHMILEVLAYADEEARSIGRTGVAVVTIDAHGTVTVADDGRGTDTRTDAEGRVVRKPVMSTQDVRFFDVADGPLLPDGLPRRGMSTVAARCPVLVHENHRADGAWSQTYRYGVPDDELRSVGAPRTSGTTVVFSRDPEIGGPEHLTEDDLRAFAWLRVELRTGPI